MKKHIPNALTCCNLISGCIATAFSLNGDFEDAFIFIIIGAIFDFFDGFVARLLKVSSPIGKELDSLADVITFGFAPAGIVFSLLVDTETVTDLILHLIISSSAFLITAFSALRLAKFNLDERQTQGFIGLPTPANALFWAAIGNYYAGVLHLLGSNEWIVLLIGIAISCWLLVSEIPMFALKFKDFKWKGDNILRYSFILLSGLLLILLGWGGFAVIIILYILCSIGNNFCLSGKKQA